ncbi:hypothetical protein [Limosilactobacillus mucosae]|uniref:hypothetical protein n=1 Tax=Limosilactobacillus mucosae TaxID=97478 RepID=UPI0022E354F6|nr:hypothetical protein [Limosilactobacillus mucosae]
MEINDIEQMNSEEMASWMAASLAKRNHNRILNLRIKDLFAIYDKMIDAPEEITLGDTAVIRVITDKLEEISTKTGGNFYD